MKRYIKKTKRTYVSPEIEKLNIDNEISILMMSGDSTPIPGWGAENMLDKEDPFHSEHLT